jgi:hypothetical protein
MTPNISSVVAGVGYVFFCLVLSASQLGSSKSETAKAGEIGGTVSRSDLNGKPISNVTVSLRSEKDDSITKGLHQ